MSRFDMEKILHEATGGTSPSVGSALIYTQDGWMFTNSGFLGILETDPEDSEGFMWFNSITNTLRINIDGTIMESSAWTLL